MRQVPTTKSIYESITKDLKVKLGLKDDKLRKTIDAMAATMAAQIKLLYLSLLDVQDNLFPDTATIAEEGGELERLGQIYLNRNPYPATSGVYTIALEGEKDAVIRSDLSFKSNEDSKNPGNLYVTDSQYVLKGTNDTLTARSLKGGVSYGLNVGDALTITEPVLGVNQVVKVVSIKEEAKEPESTTRYRQAILEAIQLEPQGGSRTDYRLWASDAQGVRKIYPYLKEGDAGVVQIYVEAFKRDSIDSNGTPSQKTLDEVLSVIEFDPDDTKPIHQRGRRPIQAMVQALPITLVPIDVQITGLYEDAVLIRDAIKSNLETYLLEVRPYIAGADLRKHKNNILYAARLQSVITDVMSSGNYFSDFLMRVNGVGENTYEFSGAYIPYLRKLDFN